MPDGACNSGMGVHMEYYADISTEIFEKIRDHETTKLSLNGDYAKKLTGADQWPWFQKGDGLKLYHPGELPEALRVEILAFLEPFNDLDVHMEIVLHEWMMSLPDDVPDEHSGLAFW